MDLELRPITEDEYPAFVRADNAAFGFVPTEEWLDPGRRPWPLDRSLAAFAGDRIVGSAAAFSFELTLPGMTLTPAAGVTWVGVLPTHRRRGILTTMMRHQLEDVRARGEAVAVLVASESVIYGRFGYGLATSQAHLTLDRRHAALRHDVEEEGQVVLVDVDDARKAIPALHDSARLLRPGEVSRPEGWWERWFGDSKPRGQSSGRFFALHEAPSGEVDGYAAYRIKRDEPLAGGVVSVGDLQSTTAGAYVALWRFVSDIDLTVSVSATTRPVDEPFRWMLADPRRLEAKVGDFLWVRLVEVGQALAARRYSCDVDLVIEVADPFCAWNEGRWHLEGSTTGAQCSRTDAEPDLSLAADDLGALYLGGVAPSTLAAAGRVHERAPGAIALADLAFRSAPAPACSTHF